MARHGLARLTGRARKGRPLATDGGYDGQDGRKAQDDRDGQEGPSLATGWGPGMSGMAQPECMDARPCILVIPDGLNIRVGQRGYLLYQGIPGIITSHIPSIPWYEPKA